MTIFAAPSGTVEAGLQWDVSGLVGTIGIRIIDTPAGATFLARTTAGIAENPAGSGLYEWSGSAPSTAGSYSVIWDDGSATPGHVALEELIVTSTAVAAAAPSGTDLCTVADVKLALEQATASTAADTLIQTLITSASRMIPERYQRDFAPRNAVTETFEVDSFYVDFCPFDVRGTNLTVTLHPEGTPIVLASTQYQLKPIGTGDLGTYTGMQLSVLQNLYSSSGTRFGYEQVSVLGDYGPAAVPDDVRRAAILTVCSWLDARFVSAYGLDAINAPVQDLRPDRFGGFAIPMQAHAILKPYQRAMVA